MRVKRFWVKNISGLKNGSVSKMSEAKVKQEIIDKIDAIAKAILHGKDVELRKTANGISVCEVSKKVVAR
jgi:hypothetical protein